MTPEERIAELEEALENAVGVIEAYQMDLRELDRPDNMFTGKPLGLAELGFCQGQAYRYAVPRALRVLGNRKHYQDLDGSIRKLGEELTPPK